MYCLNMLHVDGKPVTRYLYWALAIIKLSRFSMIDINIGYKTKEINSHYTYIILTYYHK